jgi:hypothetical protein
VQGALEVAPGAFGEQSHRMSIPRHPVELEYVVLEVDVLKKETRFGQLVRRFGDHTRGQCTQRIDPWSPIDIDRYRVP